MLEVHGSTSSPRTEALSKFQKKCGALSFARVAPYGVRLTRVKINEHDFDEKDNCRKCKLTKEHIGDKKIFTCRVNLKVNIGDTKKIKNKRYI